MDDTCATEIRRLQRQLADLAKRAEDTRRVTAGLVVALVGLLLGLSLPWLTSALEPFVEDGAAVGITTWVDGWLILPAAGEAMDGFGWVFFVAALAPMGLAALVAFLLPSLDRTVATLVRVLGWLTAVGLVLTWLVSWGEDGRPGAGMLITAVAAVVAATSANSMLDFPPAPRPAPTAASLLPPISIKEAPTA